MPAVWAPDFSEALFLLLAVCVGMLNLIPEPWLPPSDSIGLCSHRALLSTMEAPSGVLIPPSPNW